ncbi:MAG TPA: hypothetical protein VH092_11320 [Urbifossiella sp.]|nr:hypothetical protein [Urbifossiella sp.]
MATGICDACHAPATFADHLAGLRLRCKACGTGWVSISAAAATDPPPPDRPAPPPIPRPAPPPVPRPAPPPAPRPAPAPVPPPATGPSRPPPVEAPRPADPPRLTDEVDDRQWRTWGCG